MFSLSSTISPKHLNVSSTTKEKGVLQENIVYISVGGGIALFLAAILITVLVRKRKNKAVENVAKDKNGGI